MRACLGLGVGLLLAGCGTATQVAATPVRQTVSAASCAGLTPAEQLAGARLVFVGRMLPGQTTMLGGRRVLDSPARMRVERYLKGQGPSVVTVRTAVTLEASGLTGAEDGIDPQAGERWKIYATSGRQPLDTSICFGSRQVVFSPPFARALGLWRTFPVDANPRPIVPLGEGMVNDPRNGFRTVAESIAYQDGHFALRTALPVWLVTFGRFHVVSAATAFHRLRANGVHEHDNFPPLVITAVRPGSATFVTDRGRMRLPAWKFSFRGVADPASVLAVAPPDLFTEPHLHRFGPGGPGNSEEDAATVSPSGTTITISFIGAHAGSAPCDASYTATAVGDRRAVAFSIKTLAVPVPRGEACTAVGYMRTVALHLTRPLGARVLISATDGGAVPVTSQRLG